MTLRARSAVRSEAALFAGAFLLPLAIFAALAAAVAGRGALSWDAEILDFSDRHLYEPAAAGPLETLLLVSIGLGAALAGTVLVALLARRQRAQALFWALAFGGVLAFDFLLKEIFRRPPLGDHGGGYSFPSGNAMASVAVVAAIALTCSQRWRRLTLALGVPFVLAYGLALVYLWWHYPSDVIAGWCVALAWVTGLWLALRRLTAAKSRERVEHPRLLPSGER